MHMALPTWAGWVINFQYKGLHNELPAFAGSFFYGKIRG
jgi:hypothetical protein